MTKSSKGGRGREVGCKWSATAIVEGDNLPLIYAGKETVLRHFASNIRRYSFKELEAATDKFKAEGFLGGGGFGGVFKGWIDNRTLAAFGKGVPIAVKLLDFYGLQGHKQWMAEMYYLGQLEHPNIIKLIGYCSEDHQRRLLVYEFMPGSSSDSRLFSVEGEPLSWRLRMKIALGAAKGLAYLHDQLISIVFRDFKASNFLLNLECNVKLSDFGLAKHASREQKSYLSPIMGTFRYADPNYQISGLLTSKNDVYSLEVVLLDLLSGRPVIDEDRSQEQQNLITWARPYLHDNRKFSKVIDTRIRSQYSPTQALRVAEIATRCLAFKPELRPTMDEIVSELEQLQD